MRLSKFQEHFIADVVRTAGSFGLVLGSILGTYFGAYAIAGAIATAIVVIVASKPRLS